MNLQLFLLIIVVITALAFDFTNGFHDTGNAMATSIASGALKPKQAVGLSAVLVEDGDGNEEPASAAPAN